jgi:hypothetical protein
VQILVVNNSEAEAAGDTSVATASTRLLTF